MAIYEAIKSNVQSVQERIAAACLRAGRRPEEVTLVGVCKGVDISRIEAAYQSGLRHFGENRVQEARDKIEKLTGIHGITWHMVGHLQSNKIKAALGLFQVIHSVDSVALAEALSHRASQEVPIFLQVNVAGEVTKHGFPPDHLPAAYQAISRLPHLMVQGLMTIAPPAGNPQAVRPIFRRLCQLRDALGLAQLSMGMTDDFEVAVEEGATLVRIGRAVFAART